MVRKIFRTNACDDAVDSAILGWKNERISWDDRLMAARSAKRISSGARVGRTKIDYQNDLKSLGLKADFYASKQHGDNMHLSAALNAIEEFSEACPEIMVREYGGFFFHHFVRNDPPSFLKQNEVESHVRRFVNFLEKNIDKAPDSVAFEIDQYADSEASIFDAESLQRLKALKEKAPKAKESKSAPSV